MIGKIYLCSTHKIYKLPQDCIRLLITIKPLDKMKEKNIHWIKSLAPSKNLFFDMKLNKINFDEYEKIYTKEMEHMVYSLNKIEELINNGKDIALICYCVDYRFCHRKILANYFKKKDIQIIIK